MKFFAILSTLFISNFAFGQIVNSISGDKTGMYFYAIDTVLKSINDISEIEKVVLVTTGSKVQEFPPSIQGINVVQIEHLEDKYIKKITDRDIVLKIGELQIIRDQVTLMIGILKKHDKSLRFYENGLYQFYFKYIPDTGTYKLNKIKRGIRL